MADKKTYKQHEPLVQNRIQSSFGFDLFLQVKYCYVYKLRPSIFMSIMKNTILYLGFFFKSL